MPRKLGIASLGVKQSTAVGILTLCWCDPSLVRYKENLFRITASPLPAQLPSALMEVLQRNEDTLTIRINNGHRPNDVLRYFIDQQSAVQSFSELLPSLNEIFIKLVEGTSLSRQFQPTNA